MASELVLNPYISSDMYLDLGYDFKDGMTYTVYFRYYSPNETNPMFTAKIMSKETGEDLSTCKTVSNVVTCETQSKISNSIASFTFTIDYNGATDGTYFVISPSEQSIWNFYDIFIVESAE
jgi:hypothetical protein